MKKRTEKPKAKHAPGKSGAAKKARGTAAKPAADPHDPLHMLRRGTHAHRVCVRAASH